MSERTSHSKQERTHGRGHGHGHGDRSFLPALGHHRSVRLYDAFGLLIGAPWVYAAAAKAARLDGAGPPVVVDVGCGSGQLLRRVGREHPEARLVGVDPDERILAIARRAALRSRDVAVRTARWEVGYAEDLPLADGSVDRVLSSLMFHHLEPLGRTAMLSEVRRVLRPGGELVLADFDGSPGRLPAVGPLRNLPMAVFTPGEVPQLLADGGFTVVDQQRVRLVIGGVSVWRAAPA
ncbi:class I SAM-dependent methyltransferase [Pseudonocardia thermophila]|uniref:class I SAM-dependent methyltransferase n=1 Tax=Pseudonocardia thermophila TaxID=1848 RepID=UPI00248E719A|nr:class I SAM-dependent methyltransferase [Pseudonocardia thermophila]